jgi:hypothetical protein
MAQTTFRNDVRITGNLEVDGGFGSRTAAVADATTYTVLAANSGKTHIVPNFTSSCTISLPAAAAGLEYTFISKAVAADAQNWVITSGSDTNFYVGGLLHADLNAGASTDEIVAVFPDGNSNSKLTVTTPAGGTIVRMFCDGTNWCVNGTVVSDTAPAFADQ